MKKSLLFILLLAASVSGVAARQIRGTVKCGRAALGGVIVSDGVNVARTDSHGRYVLEADDNSPFVWVATPSGYVAPYGSGSPEYYKSLLPGVKKYDFRLRRLNDEGDYEFLAIGDPQPKTSGQLARFDKECMPDIAETVGKARKDGVTMFGIILGDIVWDSPGLMGEVKERFASLGIPFYPVIGNHDHLIAESDDFASESNFRKHFGPTYYAFDAGRTHFIVLDGVAYYGEKKYDRHISDGQIEWVRKYVSLLPAGERVIVAMHVPFFRHRAGDMVGNGRRLAEILRGREVHYVTGHTHLNSNVVLEDGNMEHNVAQIGGNLWRSPLNRDGSTRGYQIFTMRDNVLSWQYKTLGKDISYQMSLYGRGSVPGEPAAVLAKVWNWDEAWKIEWREDGTGEFSPMQQRVTTDPEVRAFMESNMAGKSAEAAAAVRERVGPVKSNIFFVAEPSPQARSVEVRATDRFGNIYTGTLEME